MQTLLLALIALIALAHVWFLILEMFLFTKPRGLKTFRMTQAEADTRAVLAKNQGLYNGFLAAGLVWGLVSTGPEAFSIRLFFLVSVLVAGIYGAVTASKTILYVQAAPAALALVLLLLAR